MIGKVVIAIILTLQMLIQEATQLHGQDIIYKQVIVFYSVHQKMGSL